MSSESLPPFNHNRKWVTTEPPNPGFHWGQKVDATEEGQMWLKGLESGFEIVDTAKTESVGWWIIFFCLDALSAGMLFCTRYWFRASSLDRLDLYQVYLKMGLKTSLYSGEGICDTPFHATNYFLSQPSFFNMVLIIWLHLILITSTDYRWRFHTIPPFFSLHPLIILQDTKIQSRIFVRQRSSRSI